MSTAPTLTPTEVIDRARTARTQAKRAAAEELELALAWAHLHPCPAGETPAHWGEVDLHGEATAPLAGPGAPWVAEFAPADLGAALAISLDAARSLVGDALELAHRLPRLWDLVRELRVPAWRARVIARETRDLSVDAALFADRLIAATPDRVGLVNAARLVQEARLWFDPDRAIADEEAALAKRGVWLRHGATPATTEISMILDTPDAELFDASVRRIAHDLHQLGDTDPLDLRRARAVGVLADPQYALDLMSGREGAAPTQNGGAANLYLHLTPEDLAPGTGAVSIERLGAATTRLLTDWLARFTSTGGKVLVRPVLTSPTRRPWTGTTHPRPCANRSSSPTRTASSPAAAATPGPATWTTSPSTSRWRTAAHRATPPQRTSRPCAAPTTGSRPTPPGPTNAATTATPGPRPPDTSTTSPPARATHPARAEELTRGLLP